MRIAVVGSGIAGLASAYLLSRQHDVVLFESQDRLGGHTHTHDIHLDGRDYRIDTGFIVFNHAHYPLLVKLFDELGVASKQTTMSFAVSNARNGLEYNATDLNRLFCQRRNLFSLRFWRMLIDLRRFYQIAPQLLVSESAGPSLGDYLQQNSFSEMFCHDHLIPMASALWSSSANKILDFPARYLVQFMQHHQMLNLGQRQPWRVVQNGSKSYIEAMQKNPKFEVRLNHKINAIKRSSDLVLVQSTQGEMEFDQVVIAAHSDDALELLADASTLERDILSNIRYQDNETVLHTDISQLPRQQQAWAAWNVLRDNNDAAPCSVSYWMNLLQGFESPHNFVVSLNRTECIDPKKILRRMQYRHPLYQHSMVAAQQRKIEIQGKNRTWFAGAYWGWGFHEDGMRSAVEVAQGLGVSWT